MPDNYKHFVVFNCASAYLQLKPTKFHVNSYLENEMFLFFMMFSFRYDIHGAFPKFDFFRRRHILPILFFLSLPSNIYHTSVISPNFIRILKK